MVRNRASKKKLNLHNFRMLRYERRLVERQGKVIAGIDEAGRGSLAGPVVASAVILKKNSFRTRIDDSKRLSPLRRREAYQEIIENAWVGIGVVDEKKIDEINIFRATVLAIEEAIRDLESEPDCFLIDGIKSSHLSILAPFITITGGDAKSLSIAAASIISKVTRDNIMMLYDWFYPRYGFAKHKGYGTKSHLIALRKHGPSPIHRRSFRPIKSSE